MKQITVTSLEQMRALPPQVDATVVVIDARYNEPIRSHMLSVFLCPNVHHVDITGGTAVSMFPDVRPDRTIGFHYDIKATADFLEIINRHLRKDRDILMCQDELIEAGFERWARV